MDSDGDSLMSGSGYSGDSGLYRGNGVVTVVNTEERDIVGLTLAMLGITSESLARQPLEVLAALRDIMKVRLCACARCPRKPLTLSPMLCFSRCSWTCCVG